MNRSSSTYRPSTSTTTYCGTFAGFDSSGKERDEETGYGYFGARYMDHELMTMWLSVDPMSDKYPSLSPYNYCAWNRPTGGDEHRWIKYNIVNNPVKLVDPNGKEWVVVFDHEKKTVTIEAKYIPIGGSHASVEMAIGTWNNLSGDYSTRWRN